MYNSTRWNPTQSQREELKALLQHPSFYLLGEIAEHNETQASKYLLKLLQTLDSTKADDMLTLEKEWIKAEAVSIFLNSLQTYTQTAESPE